MSQHTDDEEQLFRDAMQGVKPLRNDRASLKTRPAAIRKRVTQTHKLIKDTLSDDFIPPCDDHLEFMRPGVQKSYMKLIRNGKVTIDDNIDLHGYQRDDARRTLLGFLDHAQSQGYKLVRVVHGKGYNSSDNKPVLKAMVNKWLQSIPEVLAFVSASPRDGGIGAVYVLLKKRRNDAE
jgi:DNA-nicking Smr family endonuclease